jgi:hypothetical protein
MGEGKSSTEGERRKKEERQGKKKYRRDEMR